MLVEYDYPVIGPLSPDQPDEEASEELPERPLVRVEPNGLPQEMPTGAYPERHNITLFVKQLAVIEPTDFSALQVTRFYIAQAAFIVKVLSTSAHFG